MHTGFARGSGVFVGAWFAHDDVASELAAGYESLTFEAVHGPFLPLLPATPSVVVDLGSGSGRDAAALAGRGHRVYAVEPSGAMRAEARRLHPEAAVTWMSGALPDLRTPGPLPCADVVLLSAVWMHLDAAERGRGMERIVGLLRPGGLVLMTLRHGPAPPRRRLHDVSAAETVERAVQAGIETRLRREGCADRRLRERSLW